MIRGALRENKPLIQIEIGWTLGILDVLALVDTGFVGELKISHQKAKELGMEVTYTEDIVLGNAVVVEMSGAIGLVSMEGDVKAVNVLVSNGEPIIGVELLRRFGYKLFMDARQNRLSLAQ